MPQRKKSNLAQKSVSARRQANVRKNETTEKKTARLTIERERKREAVSSETSEEREARLWKQRERKRADRKNERSAVLARQRGCNAEKADTDKDETTTQDKECAEQRENDRSKIGIVRRRQVFYYPSGAYDCTIPYDSQLAMIIGKMAQRFEGQMRDSIPPPPNDTDDDKGAVDVKVMTSESTDTKFQTEPEAIVPGDTILIKEPTSSDSSYSTAAIPDDTIILNEPATDGGSDPLGGTQEDAVIIDEPVSSDPLAVTAEDMMHESLAPDPFYTKRTKRETIESDDEFDVITENAIIVNEPTSEVDLDITVKEEHIE